MLKLCFGIKFAFSKLHIMIIFNMFVRYTSIPAETVSFFLNRIMHGLPRDRKIWCLVFG